MADTGPNNDTQHPSSQVNCPGPSIPEPKDPDTETGNVCSGRFWMDIELINLASADIATKVMEHAPGDIERHALQDLAAKVEAAISGKCRGHMYQARPARDPILLQWPASPRVNVAPSPTLGERSATLGERSATARSLASRQKRASVEETSAAPVPSGLGERSSTGGSLTSRRCRLPSSADTHTSEASERTGHRSEANDQVGNEISERSTDCYEDKSEWTSIQEQFADKRDRKSTATKLFDQLDIDQSGFVGREELESTLRRLGFKSTEAQEIFKAADGGGDGLISRTEWIRMFELNNAVSGNLDKLLLCHEAYRLSRNRYCMLSYRSGARICWDFVTVFGIAYITLTLPFQLAFLPDNKPEDNASIVMDWAIDIWFAIDVVLNFRTTYLTDDGFEVWDWYHVAVKYFKSWFLIDIVSSFPIDRITTSQSTTQPFKLIKLGKIIRACKLLKIGRLLQSKNGSPFAVYMDDLLASANVQGRVTLLSILAMMLFVAHMLSCLMAAVDGEYLDDYLDDNDPRRRYLSSMYWAITTITTVGYGDILPTSDLERVVVMFAMVIGGSFYGYVIGSITDIVTARGVKMRAYQERMEGIQAWCDHHRFPQGIRRRLRIYFEHFLSQESVPDESAIMNDLTPELRNDISQYMIKDEVRGCYLFENLPNGVLARIAQIAKAVIAQKQEVITNAGEVGTAMFIIESGCVQMEHMPDSISDERTEDLEAGDAFGEEIVLGFCDLYNYEAVATTRVQMLMIGEEPFVNIMWTMPDMVALMRSNAKHLLERNRHRVKKEKTTRGRGSIVGGTSSVPAGFADAVFDTLDDIHDTVVKLHLLDDIHTKVNKLSERHSIIRGYLAESRQPYT